MSSRCEFSKGFLPTSVFALSRSLILIVYVLPNWNIGTQASRVTPKTHLQWSVFHQTLNLQFDSSCGVGLVALLMHLVIVRPCKFVPLVESKLDYFCCQWWICRWNNYSITSLAGQLNSIIGLLRLWFCVCVVVFFSFWKKVTSLSHRFI